MRVQLTAIVVLRTNGSSDCQRVARRFFIGPSASSVSSKRATESRAKYAAETSSVSSIRPIPCRMCAIANIYKGLFRLLFLCHDKKKGPGGEGEALAKLGLCSLLLQSRFNRIENARSGRLHILKTLQKQLGVSPVEAEVILRSRARLKSDGRANNVSNCLCLRLADALVRIGSSLSQVQLGKLQFKDPQGTGFRPSFVWEHGDFSFLGPSSRRSAV